MSQGSTESRPTGFDLALPDLLLNGSGLDDDGFVCQADVRMETPFWEPGRKKPARGVHVRAGGPNVVWTTLCTADRRAC